MKRSDKKDVRWLQRLDSFQKAFSELDNACKKKRYTKLERSGLIQTFEFTFELAWKTLQDLLVQRGYTDAVGPRPVLQQAFQDGLITDGETWMQMLKSRNQTTHIYEEQLAKDMAKAVKTKYHVLLKSLVQRLVREGSK